VHPDRDPQEPYIFGSPGFGDPSLFVRICKRNVRINGGRNKRKGRLNGERGRNERNGRINGGRGRNERNGRINGGRGRNERNWRINRGGGGTRGMGE
jgi:hypothetical protein